MVPELNIIISPLAQKKKESMEDRITNHFLDEIEANDHTLVEHVHQETSNYQPSTTSNYEPPSTSSYDSMINNDHTIIDIDKKHATVVLRGWFDSSFIAYILLE